MGSAAAGAGSKVSSLGMKQRLEGLPAHLGKTKGVRPAAAAGLSVSPTGTENAPSHRSAPDCASRSRGGRHARIPVDHSR